jgi:sulfite reductase alpha subunit-like flavoprotein
LLIQPVNSPHLVESALQLLGLTGQEAVEWTPAVNQEAAARGCCVPPMSISSSQALAYLTDLAAVPTRRQVRQRGTLFVTAGSIR